MENADIAIEYLLAIRADVAAIKEDVRELKSRMLSIETGQDSMVQLFVDQAGSTVQPDVSLGPSTNT